MLLQASLFILANYEQDLLGMETEEMVQFLNNIIAKGTLLSDKSMVAKFKKEIKRFKLSEELMSRLKEEEEAIKQTSRKRIVICPSAASEFKYYMQVGGRYVSVSFTN